MAGWLVALIMLLALTGCSTGGVNLGGFFDDEPAGNNADQQQTQQLPAPPTTTGLKVALLLPLSGSGQTANIGKALKNAAEIALLDAGSQGITLVTRDTKGTADGARVAANAALNEGAGLILGPLLAGEVRAVGPLAQQRSVPVVAFSSVAGVAGNGVYLMSFLPSEEVDNLIRHASSQGITKIASMVPQSAYGSTTEAALNASAKRNSASIVALDRYPRTPNGISAAGQAMGGKILNRTNEIQALFLPEGGTMLANAATALGNAGVRPGSIRLFGTGLWDEAATSSVPLAVGGWYAGVAPDLVNRFEARYSQAYGSSPPRIASLAYDAVSLAIIVGRTAPGGRVDAGAITNPEGFRGVNGLFRFRPNGLIQRGLSILEVTPNGPSVISPAPERFNQAL